MATSKTAAADSLTSDKDAVMDALYWVKQIVSFILGAVAGTMHLTGFPIVVCFGVLLTAFSLFYAWQVLRADDVEAWDIVTESFAPSFFCFMLVWVLGFTFL
jgi:hypothetical protein